MVHGSEGLSWMSLLQGNVHAMKAAAGASLLSADAGIGKLDAVLNVAREALDSAMKIEA